MCVCIYVCVCKCVCTSVCVSTHVWVCACMCEQINKTTTVFSPPLCQLKELMKGYTADADITLDDRGKCHVDTLFAGA